MNEIQFVGNPICGISMDIMDTNQCSMEMQGYPWINDNAHQWTSMDVYKYPWCTFLVLRHIQDCHSNRAAAIPQVSSLRLIEFDSASHSCCVPLAFVCVAKLWGLGGLGLGVHWAPKTRSRSQVGEFKRRTNQFCNRKQETSKTPKFLHEGPGRTGNGTSIKVATIDRVIIHEPIEM